MRFTTDEIRALMADQTYPLKTTEVASRATQRYGKGIGYGDPNEVRTALNELLVAGTVVSARAPAWNDHTKVEHGYLIRNSGRDLWWMDTVRAAEFKAAMVELDERYRAVDTKVRALAEFLGADRPIRDHRHTVSRNDRDRNFKIGLTLSEDQLDRLVETLGLPVQGVPQTTPTG